MIEEILGTLVTTTRFGTIEVEDRRLLLIPEGLLGFEKVQQYCLLDHAPGSPFYWLQAITVPDLAFVVINPFQVYTDYAFDLSDGDLQSLNITDHQDITVWSIVAINGEDISTNLVGPIIVNTRTNIAKQIVLATSNYSTRHSLLSRSVNAYSGE